MTQIQDRSTSGTLDLRRELVARAGKLHPLLASSATQTVSDRRVVQANIDALAEAELFSVFTPARFGGHQADMRTMLDVSGGGLGGHVLGGDARQRVQLGGGVVR